MEEISQTEIMPNNNIRDRKKKTIKIISIVLVVIGLCLLIFDPFISGILIIIGVVLSIFNGTKIFSKENYEKIINNTNTVGEKRIKNIKCIILLIIEIASLLFFAIWAKDRGSWEGLRFLFSIPVFFIIGLITIIFSLKFLKNQRKNILVWLLLISGFIFITIIPAMYISTKIQNLIYYQEYITDSTGRKEALNNQVNRYNITLSKPYTVVDVNKNYLLLKNKTEQDCYDNESRINPSGNFYIVVYLPEVKNFSEFETYVKTSLIDKEITASINKDFIKKYAGQGGMSEKYSTEGVTMIEKVPELLEKNESFQREYGIHFDTSQKYDLTTRCLMRGDTPVDIYLDGKLLKF